MLHCVEEAEDLVRDCLALPDDADLRVRVFGGGRATIGKDHTVHGSRFIEKGSRRKEGRRAGRGGGWEGWRMKWEGRMGWDGRRMGCEGWRMGCERWRMVEGLKMRFNTRLAKG